MVASGPIEYPVCATWLWTRISRTLLVRAREGVMIDYLGDVAAEWNVT